MTDNLDPVDFIFYIKVFNDPPYFLDKPQDQNVKIGDTLTYKLPAPYDREKLPIFISVSLLSGSLPLFITYSSGMFTFSPTLASHQGNYQIQVKLNDKFSKPNTYSFILVVQLKDKDSQTKSDQ